MMRLENRNFRAMISFPTVCHEVFCTRKNKQTKTIFATQQVALKQDHQQRSPNRVDLSLAGTEINAHPITSVSLSRRSWHETSLNWRSSNRTFISRRHTGDLLVLDNVIYDSHARLFTLLNDIMRAPVTACRACNVLTQALRSGN